MYSGNDWPAASGAGFRAHVSWKETLREVIPRQDSIFAANFRARSTCQINLVRVNDVPKVRRPDNLSEWFLGGAQDLGIQPLNRKVPEF